MGGWRGARRRPAASRPRPPPPPGTTATAPHKHTFHLSEHQSGILACIDLKQITLLESNLVKSRRIANLGRYYHLFDHSNFLLLVNDRVWLCSSNPVHGRQWRLADLAGLGKDGRGGLGGGRRPGRHLVQRRRQQLRRLARPLVRPALLHRRTPHVHGLCNVPAHSGCLPCVRGALMLFVCS